MIDFGLAVAVMAIVGLAIYIVSCVYHWVLPPIHKVLEALGFGAAIPFGIRIGYGAFRASELCHIIDDDGNPVHNPGQHLTFGEHRWEILAGGVCIALGSIYSLIWLCRRPTHKHHD